MQRFIVALAGAAIILAGGCSNKAMEANPTDSSAPVARSAAPDTATASAPAAGPASTATPATPGAPATTVGEDGATRVTVAEASKAIKSGNAVLVDVRTDEQYKTQHVTGAIHIPYAQLATRLNELPQGKFIIMYCS